MGGLYRGFGGCERLKGLELGAEQEESRELNCDS